MTLAVFSTLDFTKNMSVHNERIILSGIEGRRYLFIQEITFLFTEVIAQLGSFSPSQHVLRVRESNPSLKRVKENILKKQVQAVWNKHGYGIQTFFCFEYFSHISA